MRLTRRRFFTIAAGLTLCGTASSALAKPVTWRGIALGAEAKLIISGLPESEAKRLIKLARAELDRLEGIFSLYDADSAISNLNRQGALQAPPPEMLALFSVVDWVHRSTNGLFDPTVQPLWQAYAEHRGDPPIAVLREAHRRIGWQNVTYDSHHVQFAIPDMQLTLNGIAQGFITDRIAALLRAEGLQNAIVNMGEISALGRAENGDPWEIGLAELGDNTPGEHIKLSDKAVATSAPLGTTFDGEKSHIISPLNGLTSKSEWKRVSVISGSAAIADGFSTAAVMMDEAEMRTVIKTLKGARIIAQKLDGQKMSTAS